MWVMTHTILRPGHWTIYRWVWQFRLNLSWHFLVLLYLLGFSVFHWSYHLHWSLMSHGRLCKWGLRCVFLLLFVCFYLPFEIWVWDHFLFLNILKEILKFGSSQLFLNENIDEHIERKYCQTQGGLCCYFYDNVNTVLSTLMHLWWGLLYAYPLCNVFQSISLIKRSTGYLVLFLSRLWISPFTAANCMPWHLKSYWKLCLSAVNTRLWGLGCPLLSDKTLTRHFAVASKMPEKRD